MNKKYQAVLGIAATIGCPLAVSAGEMEPAPMTPPPVEPESAVSGTLSFDLNSHFISYGFDVWGDGNSWKGPTFNPSLELNWGIGDFTLILGTWWDVNGKVTSSIGGNLQEIDVWAGGSYAFGDFSVTALYQAWIYGGDTEEIVDVILAYDTFLSPSLTIHNRVGAGAAPQTGTVLVAGLEHGFDLGPVSFAVPLNVGYFLDDGFHGTDVFGLPLDTGFGYGSIGLNASIPISFISEEYGAWDLHGGVTYYATSSDVISNPSSSFFTGNIGISCSF